MVELITPTIYPVTPTSFPTNIPQDIQDAYYDGRIPPNVSVDYLAADRDYAPRTFIIFMVCFTAVLVAVRVYARSMLAQGFGWDDGLCVLAFCCYVAFVVLCILLIDIGSGRHIEYIQYVLTTAQMTTSEKLDFYAHIVYSVALWFCRLSVLGFYHRLCRALPKLPYLVYGAFTFVTATFIVQVFLIIFHCLPVTDTWPYVWQVEILDYDCLTWGAVYTTNSALSLVSDVVIFSLPAVIISSLRGQHHDKIKLIAVLCPGVFVTAISIVRLYLVVKGGWAVDASWDYSPLLAIEVAEVGATLIAISAPGLNAFVNKMRGKRDHGDGTYRSDTTSSRRLSRGSGTGKRQSPNQLESFPLEKGQEMMGSDDIESSRTNSPSSKPPTSVSFSQAAAPGNRDSSDEEEDQEPFVFNATPRISQHGHF